MQDKYQIPGLQIKPSAKKESPPSVPLSSAKTSQVPAVGAAEESGSSEWEYYTETEPSDTEPTKEAEKKGEAVPKDLPAAANQENASLSNKSIDSHGGAVKNTDVHEKISIDISTIPVLEDRKPLVTSTKKNSAEVVERVIISSEKDKKSNSASGLLRSSEPASHSKQTVSSLGQKHTTVSQSPTLPASTLVKKTSEVPPSCSLSSAVNSKKLSEQQAKETGKENTFLPKKPEPPFSSAISKKVDHETKTKNALLNPAVDKNSTNKVDHPIPSSAKDHLPSNTNVQACSGDKTTLALSAQECKSKLKEKVILNMPKDTEKTEPIVKAEGHKSPADGASISIASKTTSKNSPVSSKTGQSGGGYHKSGPQDGQRTRESEVATKTIGGRLDHSEKIKSQAKAEPFVDITPTSSITGISQTTKPASTIKILPTSQKTESATESKQLTKSVEKQDGEEKKAVDDSNSREIAKQNNNLSKEVSSISEIFYM